MKRMTIIVGLLLIGLLTASSFWAGSTGVGSAAASDEPDSSNAVGKAGVMTVATAVSFENNMIAARQQVDAFVAVDDLNMRSGPGLKYSLLGKYPEGTALDIIGQGRDSAGMPWLYVRTPNGKRGWMSARPNLRTTQYVSINVPFSDIPFVTPATPTPAGADGQINVDDLNMRSGPGLEHQKTGEYPFGTPFEILGQSPDRDGMPWLYVQTPDGKKGWVSARPSLSRTKYVRINIPHSQIPLRVELDEVEMDEPVYAIGSDRRDGLSISGLTTVSCQNICKPFKITDSFEAGDVVCLEWYEFGIAEDNDKIGFNIRFNDQSLATVSLSAKGSKLCRAIKMTVPESGSYRALATVKKSLYKPPLDWTVD